MQISKESIITLVVLIILLVGMVAGVYLTQSRQTIKSSAAAPANLEILSPRPGEQIADIRAIKATSQSKDDVIQLTAVMRIDNQNGQSLRVTRIDQNTVGLSGILSSKSLLAGSHTLSFYLYSLSSRRPTLIGTNSVQIMIPAK